MIIGVVGFIGQGKGTVGDRLYEAYGFQRESFAKPLKDAAAIIFNWDRAMLEGDTPESRAWRDQEDPYWSSKLGKKVTPRLALQWMGTEAGRNVFGENLWTASLLNRLDPSKDYVITDVRFVNEIKALKDAGGYVVRVRRGHNPIWWDKARLAQLQGLQKIPGYEDIHVSEWDWVNSDMDAVIYNDGDMGYLYEQVKLMLKSLSGISPHKLSKYDL